MSEHTPLPWRTEENRSGMGVLGPFGEAICQPGEWWDDEQKGEAAANAIMIVRAVNNHATLVDTLEKLADACERCADPTPKMEWLVEFARDVLRCAES